MCENNADAGVVRVFQNTEKSGIGQVIENTEDAEEFQMLKNIARVGIIHMFEIRLMQGYARYLGTIANSGRNEVPEKAEDAVKSAGVFGGYR